MDIEACIRRMTLEEKASLCSGGDFWHTKAVARLGIPAVMMADGPHGLRKQIGASDHLGMGQSVEAVCFPTAAGLACSFDRDLVRTLGQTLGAQCQAEGVAMLLGPAVNIKRSPLCGRNFEYFSEDPYLAGELAAAYIQGLQSQGVGASLKHFAVNNQEHRRMSVSANVDARTLREIYLAPFETAVKEAQPWSVMAAYNRVNGVYASENKWLLEDILRKDWGFEGLVVTDWGACSDRVAGLAAGQDLEMPASGGANDQKIVDAVREGRLDEAVLDCAVRRILSMVARSVEVRRPAAVFDRARDSALARALARECIVLLKNEGGILPFERSGRIACIGPFARAPRYQGGGSSHIHASAICDAAGALEALGARIDYAEGFALDTQLPDETLTQQALACAAAADAAVVFAGLPDAWESEGYDRAHMRLPENQNALIARLAEVQPHLVVVLHNGAPVEMPWADDVAGIVEAYLGGQQVGGAVADILLGEANPCAKLAESFPLRLEDTPSYLDFPGAGDQADYREGVFVGYRYYDSRRMPVRFPFGHGLSYTSFAYSDLRLSAGAITDEDALQVTLRVQNAGARAGKEIVQLYVHDAAGRVVTPEQALRGFAKVDLAPGEQTDVRFALTKRDFAYYDVALDDWAVPQGAFEIRIGRSSRDIALRAQVQVCPACPPPMTVDQNSVVGDLLAHPVTGPITAQLVQSFMPPVPDGKDALGAGTRQMLLTSVRDLPLRAVRSFVPDISEAQLADIIAMLNQALGKRA
nr:glycoside hydrolase family 3 C-terminal domain-containing protein [Maliibacterium massiliense]